MKKKLIYISHPYLNLDKNKKNIERIIKNLYSYDSIYDNYCFVSPVHCYGYMYKDFEYYKGLSFCTDLLKHCSEMWVFGDWQSSTGCKNEYKLANELGIKTKIFGNMDVNNVASIITRNLEFNFETPTSLNRPGIKRVYRCMSEDVTNNTLFICMHLFYDNILYAINKAKPNENILIQLDLLTEKEFDMDDEACMKKLKNFRKMNKTLYKGYGSILDKYMVFNMEYDTVKKRKEGRGIYSIYNFEAVLDYKLYNCTKLDDKCVIVGGNLM